MGNIITNTITLGEIHFGRVQVYVRQTVDCGENVIKFPRSEATACMPLFYCNHSGNTHPLSLALMHSLLLSSWNWLAGMKLPMPSKRAPQSSSLMPYLSETRSDWLLERSS